MRVLMLAMDYPPSVFAGIGIHVFELSRALVKLGIEVDVVVIPHAEMIASANYTIEKQDGVTIYRFSCDEHMTSQFSDFNLPTRAERRNIIWNYSTSNTLVPVLRIAGEHNYNLIHMHDYFNVITGEAVRTMLGIPLINTVHAAGTHGNKMYYHLRHYACNIADYNIVVSKYLYDELLKEQDLHGKKFSVIRNGITMSGTNAVPIEKKENDIVFVGRITRTKGCYELLVAFLQLYSQNRIPRNSRLVFVGDGPEISNLKKYTSIKNAENVVCFTGHVDNLEARRLMRNARVLVAPSKYEAFGLVALEAMSEGTCVIATNVGGFSEFIVDDVNGLLIPPNSVECIANSIKRVFDDYDLQKKLTIAGRSTAKKMDWHIIAAKTFDVYRTVVKCRY